MIYIGCDHAGFELKEQVKQLLSSLVEQFEDLGPAKFNPADDYPDFAALVAKKIQANPQAKGILICGTGQGICIAANKFKGIRAGQAWNEATATAGRNDDDINILCLASRHQTFDEVKPIIRAFLETPFDAVDRRMRRLEKIKELEH